MSDLRSTLMASGATEIKPRRDASKAALVATTLVPPLTRSQACAVAGASVGYFSTARGLSARERELVRQGLVSLSYFHNGV